MAEALAKKQVCCFRAEILLFQRWASKVGFQGGLPRWASKVGFQGGLPRWASNVYRTEQKIVHRYVEEVSNRRNVDAIRDLISENYTHHYDDGTTSEVRGPDYVKQSVSSVASAYPDAHFTIEDMIAEGDKVVYRWIATGTHQGEDMGIAAIGKPVTLRGITILRIENGKIAERWASEDTLGMMRQLGVIPASDDQ